MLTPLKIPYPSFVQSSTPEEHPATAKNEPLHGTFIPLLKRSFVLIGLLVLSLFSHAQVPKWSGLKLFAGSSYDECGTIRIDRKDNYYISGTFRNAQVLADDSLEVD